MGEDPIGFASGDFNFYRYVINNPVNFVDPSGKVWVLIEVAGALGTVYAIWTWIDNLSKNQKERDKKDLACSRLKNLEDRVACYDKSRKEHLDKERNNSCEIGKELTPDIKTWRY